MNQEDGIRRRLRELSTTELEAIVNGSDTGYTPQAAELARAELSERAAAPVPDLAAAPGNQPNPRTGLVRASVATAALWLMWALVLSALALAYGALVSGDLATAGISLLFLPPAIILVFVAKFIYGRWYRNLTVIAGAYGAMSLFRVLVDAFSANRPGDLAVLVCAVFSLAVSAILDTLGTRAGWYVAGGLADHL